MITMNEDITVIIVLYNSSNIIFNCLKELNNFKVIIVDNGKNKNILKDIKNNKNITVISKNINLGFGKGINYAFNFIKTKFFLILNPDIVINELSIIRLLNTIKKYPNCAIAAPLNLPDNDSYGILPEKRSLYEKNRQKNLLKKEFPEGEICVDVTKGCAMLINSKYFKDVNFFSEKYFLFWEEIDLCRKFIKKKLSIIVNPYSKAHHKEGSSSKLTIKNFFLRQYHYEISPLYYFEVKKTSIHLYKNMTKYLFRFLSYLLVLNFKNSLKNLAKLIANIKFILKNY